MEKEDKAKNIRNGLRRLGTKTGRKQRKDTDSFFNGRALTLAFKAQRRPSTTV